MKKMTDLIRLDFTVSSMRAPFTTCPLFNSTFESTFLQRSTIGYSNILSAKRQTVDF